MFSTYATRIYSSPVVIDRLAVYVSGGFISRGVGLWLGERETAAVLEVVGDEAGIDRLISRAHILAASFGEDSILATAAELNAAIVTASGDRLPVVSSIQETIRANPSA